MSLLAPGALWFLLVGGGVVALYLLRIRRQRHTVPSLEFWQALAGPLKPRSLFQRLKRWLSLALWLLIVTCLVFALANPVLSLGRIKPESIAIILDNSASMQTIESDASRTSEPQAQARGASEPTTQVVGRISEPQAPARGASEPQAPARGNLAQGAPSVETPARSRLGLRSDHPTRFSKAIAAIREMLDRRPVDDEWLLIDAARTPQVVQSWTRDRRSIRDAADAIRPHLGSADLPAAVALANQLLEGKTPRSIIIISDGAAGGIRELAAKDEFIKPWIIGTTDENLGISVLRARMHRQQAAHFIHARVVNASNAEVKTQLVFELDGEPVAVEPFTVAATAAWEKTISIAAPEGGMLRAFIDRPDALAADNEAWAILEPIRPARVLLVSEPKEAFFFEHAMMAMDPLVDAANSRTVALAEYEPLPPAEKAAFDLTIFNNAAPMAAPPAGAFVFVNRWPADLPARIVGEIERPALTLSRRDHPLMQYLTIGGATVTRASQVTLTDRAITLADVAGGSPLIFLFQQPERNCLCLAFDVLQSDLPIRNAFPILLRNAVVNLVAEQSAWVRDQYAVGEPIEPLRPLPSSCEKVLIGRWKSKQVVEEPLAVQMANFRFADTAAVGPLRFRIGDDTTYAAVNLTDENESRIAPPPNVPDAAAAMGLTGRLFGTVPWLALAMLATGLIALEWLTYHYRWTE